MTGEFSIGARHEDVQEGLRSTGNARVCGLENDSALECLTFSFWRISGAGIGLGIESIRPFYEPVCSQFSCARPGTR